MSNILQRLARFVAVAVVLVSGLLPVATVAAAPGAPVFTQATHTFAVNAAAKRFATNWPWYITRASGLLATILLLVLILSGVGLITGYTYKFLEPLPAWAAHRAMGLAFAAMVFLHVFSLPFDKYIGFSLGELLVPFMSQYKPLTIGGVHLGSLYVALGIIALYSIVIVTISSLLWVNNRPKLWRTLHYFSYVALFATAVHGFFIGTDLQEIIFRILWVIASLIILVSIVSRLLRARTINKDHGGVV